MWPNNICTFMNKQCLNSRVHKYVGRHSVWRGFPLWFAGGQIKAEVLLVTIVMLLFRTTCVYYKDIDEKSTLRKLCF